MLNLHGLEILINYHLPTMSIVILTPAVTLRLLKKKTKQPIPFKNDFYNARSWKYTQKSFN